MLHRPEPSLPPFDASLLNGPTVNGNAVLDRIRAFRPALPEGRPRGLLDVFLEHTRAELVTRDIETTMRTLTDDPVQRYYGASGLPPARFGYEVVRAYYLRTFELPLGYAGLEFWNLAVGEDVVAAQGAQVITSDYLRSAMPHVAAKLPLDRQCVVRKRACVLAVFDGLRIAEEVHYLAGDFRAADVHYL